MVNALDRRQSKVLDIDNLAVVQSDREVIRFLFLDPHCLSRDEQMKTAHNDALDDGKGRDRIGAE
ncbi:hypothetical protein VDT1_1975 [Vibrio sp. 16]|nr:hypothetical protein VDT1_1975 [Vibrio sp. 16]